MKLTNNTRSIKSSKGMTLLELTVVILVLLSLISILFVGARAWKRGSDRAANIMNLRNVQQAVRGHANMFNLTTSDDTTSGLSSTLASTTIFGALGDGVGGYLKTPTGPNGTITYAFGSAVPPVGQLYTTVTYSDSANGVTVYGPDSAMTAQW